MIANKSNIVELAELILENAKSLDEYIQKKNIPQPSFGVDGPPELSIPAEEEQAMTAKSNLINASKLLHGLVLGPYESVRWQSVNDMFLLGALRSLCHFNVPQSIPIDGEKSYNEIAALTGIDESILSRLICMTATDQYFSETRPGFVSHTARSKLLAMDEGLRASIWLRAEEFLPAIGKLAESIEKFPNSEDVGSTAYSLAFGEGMFTAYEKNPTKMELFGKCIQTVTRKSYLEVANAYEWEELGNNTVVDVGGGNGHVSASIGAKHREIRIIVQDRDHIRIPAEELIRSHGLETRISFMGHDFFKPQPAEARHAAVFFLRNVFHNWPESYCKQILLHIVDAMGPQSKILICDIVLPPPGSILETQEAISRTLDLHMLTLFNSKERTTDDWVKLLQSVNKRLKITRIIKSPKMVDSLIEIQLEEESLETMMTSH